MRAVYAPLNKQGRMSPPVRETYKETGGGARGLCAAAVDGRTGQDVSVDTGGLKRGRRRCARPMLSANGQGRIPHPRPVPMREATGLRWCA